MSLYAEQRNAADKLLSQQKAIIGQYASRLDFSRAKKEYSFKVDDNADKKENTDLFFFEYKRLRIACRMRFDVTSRTFNDITIRSYIGSGNPTELDKINKGFGDYMLYCWGTHTTIKEFIIIDLDEFRAKQNEFIKSAYTPNLDNYTGFASYDLDRIIKTPCCVVANLEQKERKQAI